MRAFTILTGMVLLACAAGGQTAPSFEVASIRVHQDPQEGNIRRRGFSVTGSRVGATAVEVRGLIGFAYGLEVEDIPGDIASERYDVAAKASGEVALTQEQARQMMQSLLADRFQLRCHTVSREVPVYLMHLAKKGSKLKASAEDTKFSMRLLPTQGLEVDGEFFKWSTEQLAAWLGASVGRQVRDKTGLTGTYDFTLRYTAENRTAGGPDVVVPDLGGPSIFTALEEQLGLALESGKGTIQTMVIDRIARPSEN
jgi:uncharacterized protein (TIGR03435 family)